MEYGMDMIREISTSNTRQGMGDVVCREKVRHTVARDAPFFFPGLASHVHEFETRHQELTLETRPRGHAQMALRACVIAPT